MMEIVGARGGLGNSGAVCFLKCYALRMSAKWEKRFTRIRRFGWAALAGLAFCVLAMVTRSNLQKVSIGLAIVLIAPAFVYIYVVTHLHWKDRYRGRHSDLWGVIILIETTGWSKIVYLFRHLIPDMNGSGRYSLDRDNTINSGIPQ
jgi:drug/metabolite transporter (DMT)-like permease